jgi:hypothetical protein
MNGDELLNKLALMMGAEMKKSNVVMAPDMGGNFKGEGRSFTNGPFSADIGKYSTNTGENYYGTAGVQPLNLGQLRLGAALGAYGPDLENRKPLNGLLASYPLFGGDLRAVIGSDNALVNFTKTFK